VQATAERAWKQPTEAFEPVHPQCRCVIVAEPGKQVEVIPGLLLDDRVARGKPVRGPRGYRLHPETWASIAPARREWMMSEATRAYAARGQDELEAFLRAA